MTFEKQIRKKGAFEAKKKWTETGTFQPKKLVSGQFFSSFFFLIGVPRVKLTWSVTSEVTDSCRMGFFFLFFPLRYVVVICLQSSFEGWQLAHWKLNIDLGGIWRHCICLSLLLVSIKGRVYTNTTTLAWKTSLQNITLLLVSFSQRLFLVVHILCNIMLTKYYLTRFVRTVLNYKKKMKNLPL